jgi:hypothetical protein
MGPALTARFACVLVVAMTVSVMPLAHPVDAAPGGEVSIIKRGLGQAGRNLTKAQRACLERSLVDVDPALGGKLRRAGSLRKVDGLAQGQVFDVVQHCAPIQLGKALLASFPPLVGTKSTPNTQGLGCLGGSVPPGSVAFLTTKRDVPTTSEMATLALALYVCAPEYVTSGPLAHGLSLTERQSTCLAEQITLYSVVVPEVSRIMFGRAEKERSETLNQLIKDCTDRTPPAAT